MRGKRNQVIFGTGVIVAVLIYLLLSSFSSTKVYYYTLDELGKSAPERGRTVRISGELVRESVQFDPGRPELRFALRNRDGTITVPVSYADVMPDNFLKSREVVATGKFLGDRFRAESLLVKCPSKYESEARRGNGG